MPQRVSTRSNTVQSIVLL